MAMNRLLVYIAGAGHSGSTLLDLLLNNSRYVQSLGEVHGLRKHLKFKSKPCTCGEPIALCPFWNSVQAEAQKTLYLQTNARPLDDMEVMLVPKEVSKVGTIIQKASLVLGSRLLYWLVARTFARAHHNSAVNSLFLYEMVRNAVDCPIVIDSTKDARRMKVLYFEDPDHFRLLYLIRDGRAVAASHMRREQYNIRRATMIWVTQNRHSLWAQRGIPRKNVLWIRYETLCINTRQVMKQIFGFIGIPFDESILTLRKTRAHNIGGNQMRFRKDETCVRLDDRWRKELTPRDLEIFDRIGGKLNRRLGYT